MIRENILKILKKSGAMHGYDIHKLYIKQFGKVTRESVYYNLRKGVELGEFEQEVRKESGNYSWGDSVNKKYYKLAL